MIVRDVLSPDPKTLLERLKAMHDEEAFPELRVAYLRPGGADAATQVELGDDVFSDEIEQAERWRNERGLEALIVVVARGDEAKLSSLEDFGTVTSRDLKRVLVERAWADRRAKTTSRLCCGRCSPRTTQSVSASWSTTTLARRQGRCRVQDRVLARTAPARASARPDALRQSQGRGDGEAPGLEPRGRRAPPDAHAKGPSDHQAGRRERGRPRRKNQAPRGPRPAPSHPIRRRRHERHRLRPRGASHQGAWQEAGSRQRQAAEGGNRAIGRRRLGRPGRPRSQRRPERVAGQPAGDARQRSTRRRSEPRRSAPSCPSLRPKRSRRCVSTS